MLVLKLPSDVSKLELGALLSDSWDMNLLLSEEFLTWDIEMPTFCNSALILEILRQRSGEMSSKVVSDRAVHDWLASFRLIISPE